jgi:hypothetical protein
MPAEEHAPGDEFPHCRDSLPQSFAVARRSARTRWSMRTHLPEWEVAAEDRHTAVGERFCGPHQQWRLTVGAGAVRQNYGIAAGRRRAVQKTAHRRVAAFVQEWLGDLGHVRVEGNATAQS